MKKVFFVLSCFAVLASCQGLENSNGEDNVALVALKLDTDNLTIEKGASEPLIVLFNPSNASSKKVEWSSSKPSVATVSNGIVTAVSPGRTEIVATCDGLSDKCVVTVICSATSVTFNKTSLNLVVGDSDQLEVTVEPAESTDNIEWVVTDEIGIPGGINLSFDPQNQTQNHKIVTVSPYKTGVYIVKATAGKKRAECTVTAAPKPYTAVDLGVVVTRPDNTKYKVLWAERNLGAVYSPEEWGDLFSWGAVEPDKTNSYSYYYYTVPSDKYPLDSTDPDAKGVLYPEDDAAHVILGDNWRMPTAEECEALINQCDLEWVFQQNGAVVQGFILKSRVEGNTNSIYFPKTHYIYNTQKWTGPSYWTSSYNRLLWGDPNQKAYSMGGNKESGLVVSFMMYTAGGHPIRPVKEESF